MAAVAVGSRNTRYRVTPYGLPGPVFHRLDCTSFGWRLQKCGLAGCAYDTGAAGWDGAYAANDVYDGFYGPDIFIGGVGHQHWDDHHLFHYGSHGFRPGVVHGSGFGGFHSGGMHIAHAGGIGGHGRA